MSQISAQRALELWREAGLLGPQQVQELDHYLQRHPDVGGNSRLVSVFSVIGAILAGLGLVLYVAGHWSVIGPLMRVAILFSAYLLVVAVALAAERGGYARTAASLWLMASLTVGANIFLIGQIFNFSLTFWQGPFIWMVAVLAMAWATRSSLQAWLAIPLALLALGWFGGGDRWFTDDQLEFLVSSAGLRPLFPIIGLILVSIGLLARRSDDWRFAASTWIAWGALLIAVPLLLASFHLTIFTHLFRIDLSVKQWVVIAVSLLLLAASLVLGDFRTRYSGTGLTGIALFLYLLVIWGAAGLHDEVRGPLYIGFIIVVFLMCLLAVWIGTASRETALVNIGIGATGVFILGQYFSWSLQLLDRALAFVIGGALLIAIAWWAERQRRRLLQEMAA